MQHQLQTVDEVVDALGGIKATATLVGAKYTAAHNRRTHKRSPAKFYLVLLDGFASRGLDAPASLWGMRLPTAEPPSRRRRARRRK